MPLVDLATAKRELRVTHDAEDADIERKVAAAVEQAEAFLNRRVFEDPAALAAAIAAAPAGLATATTAYDTAMEAAGLVEVAIERTLAERYAESTYRDAQHAAEMVYRGMVVNDSIRTGILLTAASLWEHRGDEDVIVGVPQAARTFLWPFRVGLGI